MLPQNLYYMYTESNFVVSVNSSGNSSNAMIICLLVTRNTTPCGTSRDWVTPVAAAFALVFEGITVTISPLEKLIFMVEM
jgi:hypothetical protein